MRHLNKLIIRLLVATTPLQTILTGCTYYNATPQEAAQPQTKQVQLQTTERNPTRHAAPVGHTSVSGVREIISALEPNSSTEKTRPPVQSVERPVLIPSDQKRTVTSPRAPLAQRPEQILATPQVSQTAPVTLCRILLRSPAHYHAHPMPEEEKQALLLICTRNSRIGETQITRKKSDLPTHREFRSIMQEVNTWER